MIDTLKVAKWLRDAGFSEPQAEAVVAAVQEAEAGADLATKRDLADVRTELKGDIDMLRNELRQSELRSEAKLEAVKSDILSRVFSMIFGASVINVIAIVGAMFGVAKLLGH